MPSDRCWVWGSSSCICFPGLCLWAANLLTVWYMMCKWGWSEKIRRGLAFFIYFTCDILLAYRGFFFFNFPYRTWLSRPVWSSPQLSLTWGAAEASLHGHPEPQHTLRAVFTWRRWLFRLGTLCALPAKRPTPTIPPARSTGRRKCDTLILTHPWGHVSAPPAQSKRLGNGNVN